MKRAFFTVELALLMPVIFLTVFSVIELTFFVHDRSVLLSESSRAAWLLSTPHADAEIADHQNELLHHLIASPEAKMTRINRYDRLSVSATAHLPLSTSAFRSVKETASVRRPDAARTLRLLRLHRNSTMRRSSADSD